MKTMTKNSKEFNSNISNRLYDEWTLKCYNKRSDEELPLGLEDWLFATYEISKFDDAILFHMKMGVYFDNETFANIKKLFMNDIDKKGASQAVKDSVESIIDEYIEYYSSFDEAKGKTKKVMFQEIDDLYYSCISLIRDASTDEVWDRSEESIDDYYNSFLEKINNRKELLSNLDEGDILYSMFEKIELCRDFHMIDALYNKLGEYLEANFED